MRGIGLSLLQHLAATLPDPETSMASHVERTMNRGLGAWRPSGQALDYSDMREEVRFEKFTVLDPRQPNGRRQFWAYYGLVLMDVSGDEEPYASGPDSLAPTF